MSGRKIVLLRAAVPAVVLFCVDGADNLFRMRVLLAATAGFASVLPLEISPELAPVENAASLVSSLGSWKVLNVEFGLANRRFHEISPAMKVAS